MGKVGHSQTTASPAAPGNYVSSGHWTTASADTLNASAADNQTAPHPNIYDFSREDHIAFLVILFLLIVIGNVTVLVAIGMSKAGKRSRMNFFIMHLAAADLSVGLVSVLTDLIWKITITWQGGDVMCKIVRYLQAVVTYASTYMLVALSVDRLDAIARPMSFTGSGLRAKVLVSAAWIASMLFSLPMLVINKELRLPNGAVQCWIDAFTETWHWQVYMSIIATVLFIIPAIIITICYAVIIYIIWDKSKVIEPAKKKSSHFNRFSSKTGDIKEKHNSVESKSSSRGVIPQAKIRTIKMTLLIVIVFILCWSPYFIFDLLDVFRLISRKPPYRRISVFIQSLAPLNSVANPIIYGIFSTRICRNLRRIPACNWMLQKLCCCAVDSRHFQRQSTYTTSVTAYSTVIDESRKGSRSNSRRPSGPPCVRDNLTEKENEILLKSLGDDHRQGAVASNSHHVDNQL